MIKIVNKEFNDNNIPFVLLGGSVLGSIRHNGFIPWDDDMDIGILRKDYEKAEEILSRIPYYTYEKSDFHIIPDGPTGHLRLLDEKIVHAGLIPTIDVFALDAIPDQKILQIVQKIAANIYHLCVYRKPATNRGLIVKLLTKSIIYAIPGFILDYVQKQAFRVFTYFNNKKSCYTGNLFGYWKDKEVFDTTMYTKTTTGTFEGIELPLPKNPHEYLVQLYGDYMTLPPIEQRKPKHIKTDY